MESDAEVICGFMVSLGVHPRVWFTNRSVSAYQPVALTLDRLRLVQARLTDEQWERYCSSIRGIIWAWTTAYSPTLASRKEHDRAILHASAEDKVKALASVLRGSK